MRRRLRLIEAGRRPRSGGYSLVEVVISILLASVIVTSVFSVVLSSKTTNGQNGRNDRHQIAGQAMKEVSSALRNFVTGCCDVTATACKASGVAYSCNSIPGPNSNNATTWSFNSYILSAGQVTDSSSPGGGGVNDYALYTRTHYLAGVLPPWFTAAPYNAQVSYTVSNGMSLSWINPSTAYPTPLAPQVQVNVTWTEP